MNGRENFTPSEPRSMTQPSHVLSSLPPSAVYSSVPPLSPSPSSYRRNSLRSMSLSPSLFRDPPSAHVENRDSSIWFNENPSLPPSSLKRRAEEDIDPLTRHYRSVSMDNCFNDSLKLPPCAGYVSSTSSVDGEEYTVDELKKVWESSKLSEAPFDPEEAKRILVNRKAAKSSNQRKSQYITGLERRVKGLLKDKSSMDKQITLLEEDNKLLTNKQKEIKIRLESLGKQAQLRDETGRLEGTTTLIEQGSVEANRLKEVMALNEQLRIEIQQLKIATGEVIENHGHGQIDESNMHQMDPNMFQQLTINEINQAQTNPDV